MNTRLIEAVFNSKIDPTEKLILVAMIAFGNGARVLPSVRGLELHTGLSERTVRQTLMDLRNRDFILVNEQCPYRNQNRYRINEEKLGVVRQLLPSMADPDTMERAAMLYELYPRKVARPEALKAIIKALKSHGITLLEEKVRAYAKAVENAEPRYIPHPSSWFNQERFNDDPATWKIREDARSNSKPSPWMRKKAAEDELAKLRNTNYPSVEQSSKMRELKRVIAECNRELVKG